MIFCLFVSVVMQEAVFFYLFVLFFFCFRPRGKAATKAVFQELRGTYVSLTKCNFSNDKEKYLLRISVMFEHAELFLNTYVHGIHLEHVVL